MKSYLSVLIILLSVSISFSQTREWKSINEPAHDNCYGLLSFEIQRRPTSANSELYEARIIFTTGQFDYDFEFSFKGRKEGSWGRITVPATGRKIVELYGTYTVSESINFDTERLKYLGLQLEHLRGEEQYALCGEGANEVSRRDEAKGKSKENNTSNEVQGIGEHEINNTSTENQGYQVLDVDTSEFEAEKLRKQELSEEQAKRHSKQITNEDRKEQFKAKQLAHAQNFINKQKQQAANQERLNQKLANDLTQTFNQISNSWAKEQDYMNQISSLSQIKSTSVTGIIKEARQKQKQLEDVFNRKAIDLDKDLATSRTRVLAAAKNETQAAVGELLSTTATVLAKRKLQKDERDARQNLERQKERELSKIAEKLKEKYYPIKSQSLEAATLAVKEETELYYLKKYEFANCMIENANDIIGGSSSYCNDPKTKNSINKKHTGQSYYEAYKRKSKSLIPEIQNKAGYFLELAIKKEPTNTKWLLEKLDKFELSTKQQLAIMKHCLEIDQKNLKLKKKYTKKLRLYSNMKYAIESNKNDVNKVDVNKIQEQKLKDLNPEFEDVKFVSNNVFLISKFSGKIIKVKSKSIFSDKFSKKLHVREKLYGLVDSLGNIIAPMKYNEIGVFSEGKATALIKKKYGFINLKGETVIPFEFKYKPSEFKNGYSIIYKLDKVWKLMFSKEKTFKLFIDSSGKEINGKKYDALNDFSEGLALAEKSKLNSYEQNFIDKKGNVVIPLDKYYGVKSFSEGLAAVQIKSKKVREQSIQKWGFINTSGDVIIDCVYDNVTSFVNNQATVQKNNKKGIIDKQNAIVIPIEYDKIFDFVNGYALIVLDNKMGLINKQNEIIVPAIYDARYYHNDMNFGAILPNYIFLKKDNKWGVLNKKGEVAVDFKYNNKETIFELFD